MEEWDFTPYEYRVLGHLIVKGAEFGYVAKVKGIAYHTNGERQSIGRAITSLCKRKIIRVEIEGMKRKYYINPTELWLKGRYKHIEPDFFDEVEDDVAVA